MCVGEFWGIELCLLAYVGWWCDASVCSWELCMACYEVEGCGILFSLSSLHIFVLPPLQRRLQLSILTFLPPTKTSTAFLCPPKLNSTLMIQCFLPLPRLGAAAASQARRTGWGVGMAYRAGGDLAGLLHTAAIANYVIWPQPSHYSLQLRWVRVCRQKGRSCCWDVPLWPDLCKHQQNQLPSFRALCNEDFSIWDYMNEVQCGGVTQISLKSMSTYWRQWSSYLCLQYAINTTLFRKYSMENIPWVN